MMVPFLHVIARYIADNHTSAENLCVILPNKRGALYLKQHLAKVSNKTIWLPTVISAEDLVAELSGLSSVDSIDLMCELYNAYTQVLKEKAEPFESFARWGTLMLQDFNEADRYLVDTDALYRNLKEIKEIENWSLSAEALTDTQQDYVNFMSQMGDIYEVFKDQLLRKRVGYQGLMYRLAVERYSSSPYLAGFKDILICGFNALNKAETIIFSELVKQKQAHILWDADVYYTEQEGHEAGLFLRKNFAIPAFANTAKPGDHFREIPKHIDIVAVPRQVGQTQVVANQLREWVAKGYSLDKTAVVLADESLLFPLLSQLPKEVEHVNITMEYPVRLTPLYDLAESLIQLHHAVQQSASSKSFYYKDLLQVLYNSFFTRYFESKSTRRRLQKIIQKIIDRNYVWLNMALLRDLFENDFPVVEPLFTQWTNAQQGIAAMSVLMTDFNDQPGNTLSSLEREYIFVFNKYFNRLRSLLDQHTFLNSLQTLRSMFRQVVGSATIPFIGEPLKGLQIMGVLETRTLDFEHIMVLGVNEDVLPSGRSNNSFIPNDLKRYHDMPLYGDKDAIYAYHFYRLLQRASHIVLTYNTEHSILGSGEKSRFITQLQFELSKYAPESVITERILTGAALPVSERIAISIPKNTESLQPIIRKLTQNDDYSGLSPSAMISYKDCPLRFYFRYGAGMKETAELEETAEANTFGSILHESLETLYLPYVGRVLQVADVQEAMNRKDDVVSATFRKTFSIQETLFGKNFLQQKVLDVYVGKLLKQDKHLIEQGDVLSILALEKGMQAELHMDIDGKPATVYIKGSADRIDRFRHMVRIIDYKSSVKPKDKFEFLGFEELFSNPDYDKMLQLFVYAWLAVKQGIAKPEELMPCIIPFRKFEEQPRFIYEGKQKQPLLFSADLLRNFEYFLADYIRGMIAPGTSFTQTEDPDQCTYCAYARMCNVV
ncbi:MAG: PD-(D/E)XK nuclease family protein [Bacteroidetes bacterium]|nr:PD-(D/E)XK nuclease family protein [Bacteroidota bacterium]